ncbi:MAG TPA: hypothetical protein VMA09_01900 [Candidatus Binataceae bacterium]|nr:hypothetical protein [Candidatus Binataceae bacterium]
MPRAKSLLATVAVIVMIGLGAQAYAIVPCALLTADDVAGVTGGAVNEISAAGTPMASTTCTYSTSVDNGTVTLMLGGGAAQFDQSVSFGAKNGMPYTALSGVADKAYVNNQCGQPCAQVFALKGSTYFLITVQQGPNDARSAEALARKVAARTK